LALPDGVEAGGLTVSEGSASDGWAFVLSGSTHSRAGEPLQIYAILFAQMQPRNPVRISTTGARHQPEDGRLLRGARSRARIREAARALFQERGFDAATLRAIAARAGMGASSIYRHVQSKHELLVLELADLQEEAWLDFRRQDTRTTPTRERIQKFFQSQHELLARHPDLTVIAIRATTYPDSRISARVLALNDRTIGLLAEILQGGCALGDLDPRVDVLSAARALFHGAIGARISWANGLLTEGACRTAIEGTVELLFRGLGRAPDPS
jgi:AcrR family transcriptional regulator